VPPRWLPLRQSWRGEGALRGLTDDERDAEVEGHIKSVDDLDAQIKAADADQALLKRIGTIDPRAARQGGDAPEAPLSLGEHFVKHAGARSRPIRASTAPRSPPPSSRLRPPRRPSGRSSQTPVLTQFDRTIIQGVRPRLTIADLLGSGDRRQRDQLLRGGCARGRVRHRRGGWRQAAAPRRDPTIVTDSLKKIAGFIKLTDEMTEDLDFFVSPRSTTGSSTSSRRFEEQQLLNGAGTGSTVTGLLNRSGIQTETQARPRVDNADAVFRAMTKVQTATGLDADGIVINPTDYQAFRLKKDANSQYYGGGFFQPSTAWAASLQPPLWGLQHRRHPGDRRWHGPRRRVRQAATTCTARAASASSPPTRTWTTSPTTSSPCGPRSAWRSPSVGRRAS
jgi:HK97 family phage major capsid protein